MSFIVVLIVVFSSCLLQLTPKRLIVVFFLFWYQRNHRRPNHRRRWGRHVDVSSCATVMVDCCMLHLRFCVIKPSWRIKWLSTWDMTLRINNKLPVQWSNGGASQADHHQQHKHHQCERVLKYDASAHTLWWNQNKAVNYGRADTGDVSDYWGWGWRRWSQRCIVGIGQCWGRGGRRTGRHGARPFLWVL